MGTSRAPLLPDDKTQPTAEETEANTLFKKLASALFYGLASFLITVVNKTILTTYKFPSFQVLGIGQMLSSIVVLYISKKSRVVNFPDFEKSIFHKIWPLPVIFLGNMIFGLGGTKELSLPMFTALRRFSILMTMIGELYVLNIKPKCSVQFSVYLMILGALIAALNDLAFNLEGYVFVVLNNFFTAANGVYMKQKLESKELGKYGLMFYNNIFMIMPSIVIAAFSGDFELVLGYTGWSDTLFLLNFLLSCFMGFILSYSILACTHYNSALTTTIIGCLKNICVTYLGMVIGGDYVFSVLNFIGINISVAGSLVYTYVTFRKPSSSKATEIVRTNTQIV